MQTRPRRGSEPAESGQGPDWVPAKKAAAGGGDPASGVEREYFVDSQGFAKQMARMPGEGPTWIWRLVVVEEDEGERLFTGFEKVQGWQVYQRGIAEFDDQREEFVLRKLVDKDAPLYLHGHPFRHQVDGVTYFYFGDPYPVMRVPEGRNPE